MIPLRILSFVGIVALSNACFKPIRKSENPKNTYLYDARKREIRGVWIATVENIDWPSKKGLSSDIQKEEYTNLVKTHADQGFNMLFVQVRAASDAFMASKLEPWSEWLTGEQGKGPEPFYDPLDYMLKETHAAGLEFHAWLNLNRGRHKSGKTLADDAVVKLHPDWFYEYDGMAVYDFGKPEVRDYITRVAVQLVRDYDVDGIHFDDYFYPYLVPGKSLPDGNTFKKFDRGISTIDEWRRDNINLLIEQISTSIKAVKPHVKFGISPFGVWRNKSKDVRGSETNGGASYDDQYADTKFWLQQGWLDYIVPQVYFSTHHPKIPFETAAKWWQNNSHGRIVAMGLGAYKMAQKQSDAAWDYPTQMPRQLTIGRQSENLKGEVFFSSKHLIKNTMGLSDTLKKNFYKFKAIPPAFTWIDAVAPFPPVKLYGQWQDFGTKIFWERAPIGERPHYFAVYRFKEDEVVNIEHAENLIATLPKTATDFIDFKSDKGKYKYVVTALDREHNESEASQILYIEIK